MSLPIYDNLHFLRERERERERGGGGGDLKFDRARLLHRDTSIKSHNKVGIECQIK